MKTNKEKFLELVTKTKTFTTTKGIQWDEKTLSYIVKRNHKRYNSIEVVAEKLNLTTNEVNMLLNLF